MKKILLLSIFTLLFSFNSQAMGPDLIKFGVKAGIISQNTSYTNQALEDYDLVSDSKVGYQFGLFSQIKLLMFNVQPELLYTMNRYNLKAVNNEGRSTSMVTVNSFDVPLLFGFNVFMFKFNFGPVFNLATTTKIKESDFIVKEITTTKPSTSFAVGLGVDLYKLNFDLRYYGEFSKTKNDIRVNDYDAERYKMKINSWAFAIGYLF